MGFFRRRARPDPPPAPARRPFWRAVRVHALRALAAVVVVVGVLGVLNPPTTWTILTESTHPRRWVALRDIAPVMARSVVAAEDANFCLHWGFDMAEIRKVVASGGTRGASTISQQVAKNVFLWPGRTWLRKGLEAGFTLLIEALWPKRRIIEVYLNVAEMGEGIFGAEAAARHYWKTGAADLSPTRSARLMAVLPDPRDRRPAPATAYIARRGAAIEKGAATLREDGRAACFL